MTKMRMLSRVFATVAAAVTLSTGVLMFNSSTAYADDDGCGENSGPMCAHDTWCAEFGVNGACIHTSETWKYYPAM
jgi:hypothetical protein